MTAERLTDRLARSIAANHNALRIVWDSEIKGFGLRVTPKGAKAFILDFRYRPKTWNEQGALSQPIKKPRPADGYPNQMPSSNRAQIESFQIDFAPEHRLHLVLEIVKQIGRASCRERV